MKKRLLKPPSEDKQIILYPENLAHLTGKIGVCHQPYFFQPGVSIKFLFAWKVTETPYIIFMDTDRINLSVTIPSQNNSIRLVTLINSSESLYIYPNLPEETFRKFFEEIFKITNLINPLYKEDILLPLKRYHEVIIGNTNRKFLKETLVESFLEFYGLRKNYYFLSDILKCTEYREFFFQIYQDDVLFRKTFNQLLDDYKKVFKVRYKNFPFPKLQEEELPFWIVKDGKRFKAFKKDINPKNIDKLTIFPRAVTLTLFLRLYKLDIFIHGIGGGNYEWIQDRLLEKFFLATPKPYIILSGTFLINSYKERQFPFFLYRPDVIRKALDNFLEKLATNFQQ